MICLRVRGADCVQRSTHSGQPRLDRKGEVMRKRYWGWSGEMEQIKEYKNA